MFFLLPTRHPEQPAREAQARAPGSGERASLGTAAGEVGRRAPTVPRRSRRGPAARRSGPPRLPQKPRLPGARGAGAPGPRGGGARPHTRQALGRPRPGLLRSPPAGGPSPPRAASPPRGAAPRPPLPRSAGLRGPRPAGLANPGSSPDSLALRENRERPEGHLSGLGLPHGVPQRLTRGRGHKEDKKQLRTPLKLGGPFLGQNPRLLGENAGRTDPRTRARPGPAAGPAPAAGGHAAPRSGRSFAAPPRPHFWS